MAPTLQRSYRLTSSPTSTGRVVIITESPGLATEESRRWLPSQSKLHCSACQRRASGAHQTTAGLNVIYIEFDWATEIKAARQTVQERLATLEGILPEGIRPKMTPPASIMGQIVIAGVYRQPGPSGGRLARIGDTQLMAELLQENESLEVKAWRPIDRHDPRSWEPVSIEVVSLNTENRLGLRNTTLRIDGKEHAVQFLSREQQQMELRTIGDWIIRPRLLKTTGIAETFLQGGDRKQYQILIDPTALLEYDVTLQEVEQSLGESNINTSGGFAITGETERPIRILGRLGPDSRVVIDDLKKIPIRVHEKRPVFA